MEELGSHIISGSTEQHSIVLKDLFEDNERVVYLNQLTLPSSMPSFKLRDILMTAGGLEDGSIQEHLIVNDDFMIVEGLEKYFALKRLGRSKVRVYIGARQNTDPEQLFSIIN
jgi:hypothetical protein